MNHRIIPVIFLLVVSAFLLLGCDSRKDSAPQKEVLIYCGITMIKPISEIAEIIETRENCNIIVIKGGSGNLLKSIKTNGVGDLYLPGSESYINTCLTEGLVSQTAHVGYNKAALMVQKGNPKQITPNLENLENKHYYVVMGNPESGSIGKETRKILEKKGIFNQVMNNARKLTTDSKNLVSALKNKEADLVVNWYATSTWDENRPYVDTMPIHEKYARKKKLVIGLLKTSRQPEISKKIMVYAASEKGRKIFDKYGLYHVQ